jgi:hypothetical protein
MHLFRDFRVVLCGCLLFGLGQRLNAQGSEKMFRYHQKAARIVVVEAKEISERDKPVKTFLVKVKIQAQLPPGKLSDQSQEIYVRKVNSQLPFEGIEDTEDWFPIQVGKEIVVCYDCEDLPNAQHLPALLDPDYPADAIWHDCVLFYDCARLSPEQRAAHFTNTIRKEGNALTPIFFELIQTYDRRVPDDVGFAEAAANYLRNNRIPVAARARIIDDLRKGYKQPPAANRVLAAATLSLVQDALKAKEDPVAVGNILSTLCREFVMDKPLTSLPEIDPTTRQQLLTMVKDKRMIYDQRSVMPLARWLENQPPGTVPPSPPPEVKRTPTQGADIRENPSDTILPVTKPVEGDSGPVSSGSWWAYALAGLAVLGIVIILIVFAFRRPSAP